MVLNSDATRIDIEAQGDQTLVLEYDSGWTAGSPPARIYKTSESFSESLHWLIDLDNMSWDVIEWGIGARAFKFGVSPVRTGKGIRQKRKSIDSNLKWYMDKGVNTALNLAFYL